MKSERFKDLSLKSLIWLSALIAGSLLIVVIVFIFSNGWRLISRDFLTRDFRGDLNVVSVQINSERSFDEPHGLDDEVIFIPTVGLGLTFNNEGMEVVYINHQSPLRNTFDRAGNSFELRRGQILEEINNTHVTSLSAETDFLSYFNQEEQLILRVRTLGGGILPLIVSTLLLVIVTLSLAVPIGVMAAIYMVEYASRGPVVNLIRFAIEILAGMPSIIYGLFGLVFFNRILGLQQSIVTGALTLTILLLPIMIRSTEEALKTVPNTYREGSYGLGANKIQTIFKLVIPNALPGIMVGIILSISRIVGETAALLFTLGGFARMPVNMNTGRLSIFEQGATLTLRAYFEVQESGNVEMAAAIGIVILFIVFTLNIISKLIVKKYSKA